MTVPARLYRYQAPTLPNITGLANSYLWFSSPIRFNDPYDCAYDIVIDADDPEIPEEMLAAIDMMVFADDSQRRAEMEKTSNKIKAMIKDAISVFKGVCCLSEVNNNILMWGHYTDAHKGFCLEFDRDKLPRKCVQVTYSQLFPRFSRDKATGKSNIIRLLTTKAVDWEYEKEWRMLYEKEDSAVEYNHAALTAVYCGAQMPDTQINTLRSVVKNPDTKFYKMEISKTEFKVIPKAI